MMIGDLVTMIGAVTRDQSNNAEDQKMTWTHLGVY